MNRLSFGRARVFVLIVIICYAVLPERAVTGQSIPDSLLYLLAAAPDNQTKAEASNEICRLLIRTAPEKALPYATKSVSLTTGVSGNNEVFGQAAFYSGYALNRLNQTDSAVGYLEMATAVFRETRNRKWLGLSLAEMGYSMKLQLRFDRALELFHEARRIFRWEKLQEELAMVLNHIGGIFYDRNDLDQAFNYYYQSLRIRQEGSDSIGLAASYNNIGEIYRLRGESGKALDYYFMAVAINERLHNGTFLAINYDNIGQLYTHLGQHHLADSFLTIGYALSMSLPNLQHLAILANSLGDLHAARGDPEKAYKHYRQAYEVSINHGFPFQLKKAAFGVSLMTEQIEDYATALKFHKLFQEVHDSIFRTENMKRVDEVEARLIHEQERELVRLETQKRDLKFFAGSAVLFFTISILLLIFIRQRLKMRQIRLQKKQLSLENRMVEEEIGYKNRELTTHVMYLVNKNELINAITEKLGRIIPLLKPSNREYIRKLILDLQNAVDANIWEQFEERFSEVHREFYHRIGELFPNLTVNERKLAALLRLGMTSKEIASITHQQVSSIEVARTRLRKKMGITNRDISLLQFLANIR